MNRAQRTTLAATVFAFAATAQASLIQFNTQASFLAAITNPGSTPTTICHRGRRRPR
jgi:hypothetical protein